jgi:hypothetical protein
MNLLGAILYDPAVAVTKSTAAALALTALDTANLRLAVTVPAHGMVTFRLRCVVQGATTFPQILLGVMNGATVVGRVAPRAVVGGTAAAATFMLCDAEFTATGLTPGATNFDAAYGVEVIVASFIKYGGPNNVTAGDAWGAFTFEAWDPRGDTAGTTTLLTRIPSALTITAGAVTVGTLPAAPADWITAAAVSAGAVTKIQSGLSTYAGGDTAGTTTLLARIPSALTITAGAVTVGTLPAAPADWITAAAVSSAAVTKIQAGLPSAILDFADGVETGVTPKGALRALLATMAGTATGGATPTITFSNPAGLVSRVAMTVDADGNRSGVVLTV